MSSASDNGSVTHTAVPSLTGERIAQELTGSGHAVHGGLFIDEAGVAWLLGCSVRTLRNWRADHRGPPSVMTHRRLYPIDELAAWLQSRVEA